MSERKTESAPSQYDLAPVNETMHAWLTRLAGQKPLQLEDYLWDDIQPELVSPELRKALVFVTLVESNPSAPGTNLLEIADRTGATWLSEFVEYPWLPQETMHGVLFREAAIHSGVDQDELDLEIAKVKTREFPFGKGYSDLKASTYGMIQELLTNYIYTTMRDATQDPVLRRVLEDVASQENIHYAVHRMGTGENLRHNPERAPEVVEAISEFVMPSIYMAPDHAGGNDDLGKKLGFPRRKFVHKITTDLSKLIGYAQTAEAGIEWLVKTSEYSKLVKLPVRTLNALHIHPLNEALGKASVRFTK